MSLQLSNFDQTGLDPEALALIVVAAAPDLYLGTDRGGTQSPEAGELGLGAGETRISGIRLLSGRRIALNDNDQPAALDIADFFGTTSGTAKFTLHIQTDDGVISTNQVQSGSGGVVRMQFTAADNTVLKGIAAGDRVIFAVTRPTKPVALSPAGGAGSVTAALSKQVAGTHQVAATLAGAAASITAALGKQAAGTLQVAASLTGGAGSVTAALRKQTGATLPLAASLAGVGGSISATLGKQSPGTFQVAASLAGAAGSITAALGKQTGSTQSVAASLAGAAGSITAALAKRAPDPPRAALAASQSSVERGRSVELRWAVANALSVEIDQGVGLVPATGSLRVAPEASTTWTLTATGASGTTPATVMATVAVTPRAPFGAVSLLPLNATPFERALEAALSQDLDIPIRKLWSSADCPAGLLPYLAWAMGVEEWDPGWPVAVKRAVVANAFAIHREKGTLAGLKRVLDTAGAEYEYLERPAGVAMTARLSIFNSNAVYLPDIAQAVNRVKRASLDLEIVLQSAASGEIPVAGGLGAATVAKIGGLSGYA